MLCRQSRCLYRSRNDNRKQHVRFSHIVVELLRQHFVGPFSGAAIFFFRDKYPREHIRKSSALLPQFQRST